MANQETSPIVYAARPCPWHPNDQHGPSHHTFSVAVGVAGSRAAALFRVKGSVAHGREVDALVDRLVDWLNSPVRIDVCPYMLEKSNSKSARIMVTPAGKKAGFLPVMRR